MAAVKLTLEEVNGNLPMVCLYCGERARRVRHTTFHWHPQWLWFTFPFAFLALPYAIFVGAYTVRVDVQAPLCEEHRYYWELRGMCIWFGVLLLISVRVTMAMFGPDWLWLWFMWLASLVAWLIFSFSYFKAIAVCDVTDRDLVLIGVAPEFVAAIQEIDREQDRRRELGRPIMTGYGPAARARRAVKQDANIQDKSRQQAANDDAIRE
jgi:hypothetical protein